MAILVDFNGVAVSESTALLAQYSDASKTEIVTTILTRIGDLSRQHKKKYGSTIVCYEGEKNWRKDKYPYYKKNRKIAKKQSDIDWNFLYECFAECQNLISKLQWKSIYIKDAEADDSIATLCKLIPESNIIISRDSDFFKLHNSKTKQYDHVSKKLVSYTGNNLDDYVREKYIKGSSKENIANVRMPIDFLTEHEGRQSPITKKFLSGELSESQKIRFEENRDLMDFDRIPDVIVDTIKSEYSLQLQKDPVGIKKMRLLLAMAGYIALANRVESFID